MPPISEQRYNMVHADTLRATVDIFQNIFTLSPALLHCRFQSLQHEIEFVGKQILTWQLTIGGVNTLAINVTYNHYFQVEMYMNPET